MNEAIMKRVRNVIVDTGNLNTSEMLRRNLSKKSSEEALTGLRCAATNWRGKDEHLQKIEDQCLWISSESVARATESETEQLSLVIKVFLYSQEECALEDAIRAVLLRCGRTTADSVIVALPPFPNVKSNRTIDQLLRMWSKVEKAGQQRLATEFGVSDLSLDELKEVVQHSENIRPATNHINLEYCCAISPELSQFAESNHIRLVTHNDPKDFFPKESFDKLIEELKLNPIAWKPKWVARYTLMNKVKGIVNCRGYLLGFVSNSSG